jgi:hypothetical protein
VASLAYAPFTVSSHAEFSLFCPQHRNMMQLHTRTRITCPQVAAAVASNASCCVSAMLVLDE